ncbi:MAG: amidohydrolase family protein, partial [Chloroflexota bacterium]
MLVIDADTHVDETEATWEHMPGDAARYRPTTLEFDGGRSFVAGDARPHRLWQIEGQFRLRRWRDDERTGTTKETRELTDIAARMRQMDELGVDVQVLYPTLFLGPISTHPEAELAICRSYNRWIAGATAASQGRLRWVAIIPFLSQEQAVEEVRFAADHGACGVFKKGVEYGERAASDPLFFPVYEEAARLNLPICVHTGSGDPRFSDATTGLALNANQSNLTAIGAFTTLVLGGIPDMFPKLRFGWIEASASWVPYLIHDLEAKRKRLSALTFDLKRDLL